MIQQQKQTDARSLKLALFGYGKMGKAIHALSIQQGLSVPIILAHSHLNATHHHDVEQHVLVEALSQVDVCIDFSMGSSVLSHVKLARAAQKPLVIGTTNWQHQLDDVKKTLQDGTIGVIYGANFAIGMQLFYQIVASAARQMRAFPGYDVGGFEWHHAQKQDSPSGTARELSDIIHKEMPQKHGANLPFASLRSGYCPGTHALFFDGPHDTIELRHTTRSREGLAQGALTAARWILSRKGLYTIEDMIHAMQQLER